MRAMLKHPSATLVIAFTCIAVGVLIPVYRLQQLSWSEAVAASLLFVVSCEVVSGVSWVLLKPSPPQRTWWRALAIHAACALAFSATWTTLFCGSIYLIRPFGVAFFRDGALWQSVWGVVIYAGIVQAARARARLREQEQAAANAELQALRAQLNPHFLFNTLHSLTQLVREDPIATQDALERFGALMRYVLDAGSSTHDVPLEEELRFVRNYLALERLRLGDRLRVVENVEEDALDVLVPPLVLQPLVENAVKHGLAPRRAGGTIQLTIRMEGEVLRMEVGDDGDGADLNACHRSNGLGLKAVARQLNARFPSRNKFEIRAEPQQGFTVRLEIPA